METRWLARLFVVIGLSGCVFDPSGPDPGGAGSAPDATTPTPPVATDAEPTALPCDPSDSDLVACWTFERGDDPVRLDDGSAYGNHGALQGVAYTQGVVGNGVLVTPATRIAVPDSASLDPSAAITFEAYVRVDALPATRAWVIDNQGQYGLSIEATGHPRCFGAGGVESDTPIEVGAWTHLACEFDGAAPTYRVYLDGVERGVRAASPALNASSADGIVIGGDSPCTEPPCSERIDAAIDEVRIWRTARLELEL